MQKSTSSGVNDVVRGGRFDKATFQKRAEERRRAEEEAERERDRVRDAKRPNKDDKFAPTRPWLEQRNETVDLGSKVGKTEIVPGAQDKRAGFYCSICDSLHKDSQGYLSHMNSKFHQKNLGMSMRVKRSTVDDVKASFKSAKSQSVVEKKAYNFKEKVKELEEKAKREKELAKEKKGKRKSLADAGDEDEAVPNEEEDAMAAMGLPTGFSTSKK